MEHGFLYLLSSVKNLTVYWFAILRMSLLTNKYVNTLILLQSKLSGSLFHCNSNVAGECCYGHETKWYIPYSQQREYICIF